jgi:hypothetical protein
VTAPYSVAFYADKDDLIDGQPPARIAYAALKDAGGVEYERAREAIKRLIAAAPYREDSENPDLAGGPGSRWAKRHLYRLGDQSTIPPEVTAYTIWIDTPQRRWWLTWSPDPHRPDRLLVHSLVPEPAPPASN